MGNDFTDKLVTWHIIAILLLSREWIWMNHKSQKKISQSRKRHEEETELFVNKTIVFCFFLFVALCKVLMSAL